MTALSKLLARKQVLIDENLALRSQDFQDMCAGLMSEELMQSRLVKRESIIAMYEKDGDKMVKAIARDKSSAKKQKMEERWHAASHKTMRNFPYIKGFNPTKAQRAIIASMVRFTDGDEVFEVAHDWFVKSAGVSRGTVKTALRAMERAGILSIQERPIRGKAMNRKNLYTFTSEIFLSWFRSLFTFRGSVSQLHPLRGDLLVTTEVKTETTEPKTKGAVICRKKALRHEEVEAGPELDYETFEAVASAGLSILGEDVPDEINEAYLVEEIIKLKETRQPAYKNFFWQKGVAKHGRRKALLAVLDTQIVREMRLAPIPDNRSWNEREVIRCPNRYLSAILKREREDCRPEITIGAIMESKQIYEMPSMLLRDVRKYLKFKAKTNNKYSFA
ncbi:MAG: hypothetical protein COA43_00535 [Robiginitomaculum sp.]|nr:MAG: hypothetical protein COA43_00535 [Robiginitomaculum sp.]